MRRQQRIGFSLYELLVLLALLGVGLGLALPAVANARATALQLQQANNLKQLVLALHNYNDANGVLPAGLDNKGFSASAYLLPYLEQDQLFKTIDFKASIDAEANAKARKAKVNVFLSPRDALKSVKDEWGATNYLYNDQVFGLNTK